MNTRRDHNLRQQPQGGLKMLPRIVQDPWVPHCETLSVSNAAALVLFQYFHVSAARVPTLPLFVYCVLPVAMRLLNYPTTLY